MDKKKLVYVGHEYHKKTHSVDFFIEILEQKYEVYYMTFDPETNQINGDESAFDQKFDVLVLFQMPVSVELLRSKFDFKQGVYVPMYDGTGEAPNQFWLDYKDFNIINFSSTLHKRLLNMGFSSYYIQYFPKPADKLELGDEESVFFWQRRSIININTVCQLLDKCMIKKIHMHCAVDPGQELIQPTDEQKQRFQFTYSTWYEKKEEMLVDMKNAAIYIAPREYEGIGMSFLEAMAMGKCVIAPDHPTMNEYIKQGFNGYLYDSQKVKTIQHIDVRTIQNNTYKYMQDGYDKWERNKNKILDWVEKDVKIDVRLMERTYKEQFILSKYFLAGKILILTKEMGNVYRLFGKIKLNNRLIDYIKKVR